MGQTLVPVQISSLLDFSGSKYLGAFVTIKENLHLFSKKLQNLINFPREFTEKMMK
jgi:hypothetical protein